MELLKNPTIPLKKKVFANTNLQKLLEDQCLCMEQSSFIAFHNSHHRYSSQGHKTPDESHYIIITPVYYNGTIHLPALKWSY